MLSSTSEYALRALSCLAGAPRDSIMLGRALSSQAAVPSTYLSKIMLVLRHAGIVTAARGSGGGYCLARPAASVSLMEIIELFDHERARPGCILGHTEGCSDRRPCPTHALWRNVRSVYVGFLESTTLADIAESCTNSKRRSRAAKAG